MNQHKRSDSQKSLLRTLKMLLRESGDVSEIKDEDSDRHCLSRLIDLASKELWSGRLENPTCVDNFNVTYGLLAVLRECMLTHRWVPALRVLTTVVRRCPKHFGRTVLHCVLELCFQLALPMPDSLVLRLKTYAELTEYEVAVECFMARVVAGQPLACCRAALAPLPRRRCGLNRDSLHSQLLVRAYDGLVSYAQYLTAQQSLEHTDDSDKDLRDETAIRMKSHARVALEKWDGLVDVPGVWDVFVVKQVELLEQAGDLDAAEDVLLTYAAGRGRRRGDDCASMPVNHGCAWPNAVQLLYHFYERHPPPNDKSRHLEVLEELCVLVPSNPLVLTLYRHWRDLPSTKSGCAEGSQDRVRLLFDLLDYAVWRNDVRPWRLLAHELTDCSSAPDAPLSSTSPIVGSVRRCWSIRKDWWPEYHFTVRSLPDNSSILSEETLSLTGHKASVAYFLLSAENSYTLAAIELFQRVVVKTKSVSKLKKISEKRLSLDLDGLTS